MRARRSLVLVVAALAGGCPEKKDAATPPPSPPAGLGAGLITGVPPIASLDPLARIVADAQGDGRAPFAAPSAEEQAAFAAIVEEITRVALAPPGTGTGGGGPDLARLAEPNGRARALGFEIVIARDERNPGEDGEAPRRAERREPGRSASPGGEETLLVLREMDGIRRGGGVYVWRTRAGAAARPLVIQAPHSFFDAGTGAIARALFERTGAAALAINTVHRYQGKEKPPATKIAPADVAHSERTYFQSFTIGTSRALGKAAYVQIHGYDPDAHPELAGFDAVASKGDAAGVADATFDRLLGALGAVVGPGRIAVYGREARTLGATANVQGRYLNAYSDDAFYHLELSRPLRTRINADAAFRERFAEAFRRTFGAEAGSGSEGAGPPGGAADSEPKGDAAGSAAGAR